MEEYESYYWESDDGIVIGFCPTFAVGVTSESVENAIEILRDRIVDTVREYGSMGDPRVICETIEIKNFDEDE